MAMSDPTFGTTDIDMEMPKRTPSLMEQIGSVVATTVPVMNGGTALREM